MDAHDNTVKLRVLAASQQAAYEAAKAQIVDQSPPGSDPAVWAGLIATMLVPLPVGDTRYVRITADLSMSEAGDIIAVAMTAGLVEPTETELGAK